MRLSSFIQTVSALAFVTYVAAEGASDVLDLKADNFESSVNPEPLILVEFFAPWLAFLLATNDISADTIYAGAVTVKLWLPIMRKLQPL
jgi:hypothetical protein